MHSPTWPAWAWRAVTACSITASIVATAWVASGIVDTLHRSRMAPWVLGRASGITSYLLLLSLVVMGLLMSHPAGGHLGQPSRRLQLKIHVALAVFTLVFTTLHVVTLATDPFAHVGWPGAFLPMRSGYRPVAVTLGIIALWSGLVTGVTAALAGRLASRVWWPVHKVAAAAFLLVWAHAVQAGSDTRALSGFYLATGATVLVIALSRYIATTPEDRVSEITARHHEARGTGSRVRS
jgi:hypothetical protein